MSRRRPLADLDPAIKLELDRLLSNGRHTIKQVTQHLKAMGAPVSKSAVGRYSQNFERVAADIRMSREMAQVVGAELANTPDDSGRMVIESLQALLLRARIELGESGELDPQAVALLSRSAKDLQTALRSNTETSQKVRERALKDAAATVEKTAVVQGLSATTINIIKASILGLKDVSHGSAPAA